MNYMPQYQATQQPIYGQQYRPTYSPSTANWNSRIRPVSSIEEVRASSIDFDGSVFYFPDSAHKKIYTKQIDLDGLPLLHMYELKEIPVAATTDIDTNNYITREEFENVIMELKNALGSTTQLPCQNPIAETPKGAVPNFNF